MVDAIVFALASAIVLGGAIGVIAMRNPVHSALSLVASFFGVAVLFVDLDAHFLAAVQVIIYTGAIVVLFLFVLMLLGVDKSEDLEVEPIAGQRAGAAVVGVGLVGAAVATILLTRRGFDDDVVTGTPSLIAPLATEPAEANVRVLGRVLFTDYLFAFEITSVLLVVAVVGAVVLARTPRATREELDELAALDAAAADGEAEPATEAPE
jgi:NADH-quinone oxidoreductase subunit J